MVYKYMLSVWFKILKRLFEKMSWTLYFDKLIQLYLSSFLLSQKLPPYFADFDELIVIKCLTNIFLLSLFMVRQKHELDFKEWRPILLYDLSLYIFVSNKNFSSNLLILRKYLLLVVAIGKKPNSERSMIQYQNILWFLIYYFLCTIGQTYTVKYTLSMGSVMYYLYLS